MVPRVLLGPFGMVSAELTVPITCSIRSPLSTVAPFELADVHPTEGRGPDTGAGDDRGRRRGRRLGEVDERPGYQLLGGVGQAGLVHRYRRRRAGERDGQPRPWRRRRGRCPPARWPGGRPAGRMPSGVRACTSMPTPSLSPAGRCSVYRYAVPPDGDHVRVAFAVVVDVGRRAVAGVLLEGLALVGPALPVVGGAGRDDGLVGVLGPVVEVAGQRAVGVADDMGEVGGSEGAGWYRPAVGPGCRPTRSVDCPCRSSRRAGPACPPRRSGRARLPPVPLLAPGYTARLGSAVAPEPVKGPPGV